MRNGRCHLHGGKCTGPRTPDGKTAVIDAHTKHGNYAAPARATNLHARTVSKRNRLVYAARSVWAFLPPEMAARLDQVPAELWAPVHPSNLPFVQIPEPTPQNHKPRPTKTHLAPAPGRPGGAAHPLPRTLAAERHAARAEAAALAPWREAIAFARAAWHTALAAKRTALAARRAARQTRREARAQTTDPQARPRARGVRPAVPPSPPAPSAGPALPGAPTWWLPSSNLPWSECGPLERELALRKAGLRVALTEQHPHPATPAPKPDSAFLRIDPMGPETSKIRDSAFSRIDPMDPESGAFPDPNRPPQPPLAYVTPARSRVLRTTISANEPPPHPAPPGRKPDSAFPRIDPLNPEPGAFPDPNPRTRPPLTYLTPTKAQALRTTTLANTWQPDLRSELAAKFGLPTPPPGWRIPRSRPPIGRAETLSRGSHDNPPNPRNET
jgi:hypothetical protein